jgi:indoleamine 2,3-dioxygenase
VPSGTGSRTDSDTPSGLPTRSALADYRVDAVTGFVAPDPLKTTLPSAFAPWDALVPNLPALIRSDRLRDAVRALPTLSIDALHDDGDRERALLLLTHVANACVWSGDAPTLTVPASIAVPLCALATVMGRPRRSPTGG